MWSATNRGPRWTGSCALFVHPPPVFGLFTTLLRCRKSLIYLFRVSFALILLGSTTSSQVFKHFRSLGCSSLFWTVPFLY
jgi:hypothetical protein